ncbi:hypothetical protein ACFWII_07270 [Streptomyces sp. NPDC127063]|uniref:virginiamycin B lyase family protein n=1 Tax=Streptomyces sp. NPDC127063 TaxID=3347123 RepID=UPI0036655506
MKRTNPISLDEHPVPDRDAGPYALTTGSAGALWFTETATDRITVDGHVNEYPLPLTGAFPSAITAGPDGALWAALEIGSLGEVRLDCRHLALPADSSQRRGRPRTV